MTFKEAYRALGLSRSTFQRKIKRGEFKATKTGEGQFAPLTFDPADLGIRPTTQPPTPPSVAIVEEVRRPEPEKANAEDFSTDLESLSTEELQAGVAAWRLPADREHGVPTNAPDVHSSTMPSPADFSRYTRALAILHLRSFRGSTATPTVRAGFNPLPLIGEGSINQYRPNSGYGLTEADLLAESDLLKAHPQFSRSRYTR